MTVDITLPKSVMNEHPEWFEHPTVLGYPRGSQRQYRYGNLHIREYEDCVTIHEDRFDPRTEPLQHILHEAPEILASAACGAVVGLGAYKKVRDVTGSAAAGGLAGLAVASAVFVLGAYMTDRFGEV